jgi:cytidine deaminase
MLQEIIVIAIVAGAVIYTVVAVVRSLRKKNASPCGDCSGCDVKKEFLLKYKTAKNPSDITCVDYRKK